MRIQLTILKKSHLLCNMILYSYFPIIINISTASDFQSSRSPIVLHHRWHQRDTSQSLSLWQLKRSTLISKLLFATFLLPTDTWNLLYLLSMKQSNKAKSRKGNQWCHSMRWLLNFWLELVLGMYLYFLSSPYSMYAHYAFYRNSKYAHNFSSDGLFVNPEKVAANGVGISEHWVVVARGCVSIIFVSNGCVAAFNLFIPDTSGSGTHINHVKEIKIWPLNEEFNALTAYFRAIYSVSSFYCNFFGDIKCRKKRPVPQITLAHHVCGYLLFLLLLKSNWNNLATGTPQKTNAFFGARSPHKSSKSATSTSHLFLPFLRFDEQGLPLVLFFNVSMKDIDYYSFSANLWCSQNQV